MQDISPACPRLIHYSQVPIRLALANPRGHSGLVFPHQALTTVRPAYESPDALPTYKNMLLAIRFTNVLEHYFHIKNRYFWGDKASLLFMEEREITCSN